MRLEQAILDRLEKRNAQIAQLQSTVHALERAADSQREHAMMERGRLLEENKKLAAALEVASSDAKKERAMYVDEQRRANGLDRQLAAACEDSNRKDHEIGALKNESGELLTHSFKLGRNNGENVKQFLDRICAEVPLESTREGLKNAVAKLQEVTAERDRLVAASMSRDVHTKDAVDIAHAYGQQPYESLGGFIGRICTERDQARKQAAYADGQRLAVTPRATDRALEIRKLMDGHAEDMKAQTELTAQLDSTKAEAEEWLKQCNAARRQRDEVRDLCAELQSKYESLLAKTTDLGSYAMTLGRKEGEPLEMFMERQALRVAALETTIAAAKCDELAKATARIKPLEALYKTLKGWQENDHIIGYGLTIDTAINKATEALSQLTA